MQVNYLPRNGVRGSGQASPHALSYCKDLESRTTRPQIVIQNRASRGAVYRRNYSSPGSEERYAASWETTCHKNKVTRTQSPESRPPVLDRATCSQDIGKGQNSKHPSIYLRDDPYSYREAPRYCRLGIRELSVYLPQDLASISKVSHHPPST